MEAELHYSKYVAASGTSRTKIAAEIVFNVCMFCSDTLPVDNIKGRPLCMRQHEQMISSCRIPGPKTDSLEFYARSSNPPKHITVVHNCQVRNITGVISTQTP